MRYVENGTADKEFLCSREKPNIFLIGDSIRMGYCEAVKKELIDIAEVFYVDDNCRNTQYVVTSLEGWKNKFDDANLVDIVHFNCGHWDVGRWSGYDVPLTSEDEYAKNIKMVIDLIKAKFIHAKIVFATTTTMNPANLPCNNLRDNDVIDRYNAIAVELAKDNGVTINDLNQLTRAWTCDYYKDYCHFTKEASALLGNAVACKIKELL